VRQHDDSIMGDVEFQCLLDKDPTLILEFVQLPTWRMPSPRAILVLAESPTPGTGINSKMARKRKAEDALSLSFHCYFLESFSPVPFSDFREFFKGSFYYSCKVVYR